MKTCPFCAEEIQDAAIRCRHCAADLTPRAPVAKGIVFYRVGDPYLLGVLYREPKAGFAARPQFIGIWSAIEKGPPVGRWPLGDGGWQGAMARYAELQPVSFQGNAPPGCPRCGREMVVITAADRLNAKASAFGVVGGIGLALAGDSGHRFGCPVDKVRI